MTRGRASSRPRGPRIRRHRLRLPTRRTDRRMAGLLAVYLVVLALLGARLVQVQVVDAERYAEVSAAQRNRTVDLAARRGRLYDREGEVLATSVESATIYADPRAFRPRELSDGRVVTPEMTPREAARRLGRVLDVDVDALAGRLASDAHFVYVARQRDWDVGERVLALDVPGVERLVEPRRVYPAGSLGAQVLGFTDIDGVGLEGLELAHDELLSGSPGRLVVEQAPHGLTIASGLRELEPATPGTDLVLTLDREIQAVAERAASDAVEEYDAVGASVVVLDVTTGDVLAAASVPSFDPSDRDDAPVANRRNRAVTDVFEPGSVQKAVTIAAALEEGVVEPGTVLAVDDRLTVGRKTFSDSHDHPEQEMTVAEIVESSSNVGTMMIAQQLGEQRLFEYLEAFGYREPTGIGFPGEVAGLLPPLDAWWETSLPTIAIGQGVAITLLRAATVYATLGNDGRAVTPRVVRGHVGAQGELVAVPAEPARQVVSPETARQIRTILSGVVTGDNGTGRQAAVAGYEIAGKTGTAQKPRVDGRGYADAYIASFVGMAPVTEPELVVAVMVDEPTPIYGGVVAAPVFREVMEFALRTRHVGPSSSPEGLDAAFERARLAAAEAAARQREEERAREQESPTEGP